jgi:bacterioferritin (cytochrome b1)
VDESRARQQCELLQRTWEAINELSAHLKNQGLTVPSEIDTSLRSTKSLLALCQMHQRLSDLSPREIDTYLGFCVGCCGQNVVTRIKCELRNVEDHLIIQAMNELGTEPALRLQQKTVKAWEPLRERIITAIESLEQAVKVERDVVSAYQAVIEENLSYWLAVEEDIVDSYTKLMNKADNPKIRSTLAEIVQDKNGHIEALGSIRQSFRKILADDKRHTQLLEALREI